MTQPLADYFEALDRLKLGRPINVPKGTKITKDAVSLEAGRGKGSIKKSRSIFSDLIRAIDSAAEEQSKGTCLHKEKLDKAKLSANQYRVELEAALAREVSLLYELYEVKKQLAQFTGSNVIPLRPKL
ncbi:MULTISPECIES: hypothetical protein [Chromobacteriaceae]|uniref:Uncharacterized protein n=1 Tax=Vogesella alkaliphila TaxID=1193621 RepID=A0ABQ2YIL1_9NEIS|nr:MULTISPECIES: hypothetical protein [Chromobacteriaceae]GGX85500.1 hypothetical protein GCM10011290_11430 [Vogesella alkaliphila]